ncbi:hypothetical protein [Duganella radicis]|uniref:Swiss Army Knife 2H phosphoesterase domain-containing protein n=1 Tax=Duganella radicis TaxID=551988 RepID=A0A6L6PID4_9BURK|nr:hypothetical protein [Duganella radicis]MTV38045.1 hypothetical protein [Duganella radicis]
MRLQTKEQIRAKISLLPQAGVARFVGAAIPQELITGFISTLCALEMGKVCSEKYIEKYSGKYHATLISSIEFPTTNQKDILKIIGTEVEISPIGLGSATDGIERCFFIVCDSNDLARLRKKLGLPAKDFHITIGFINKDVHGVVKNRESLI